MIRLTDTIWIGDSNAEIGACSMGHSTGRVVCTLNVAQDLHGLAGWPTFDYMQVGLIDGPGNIMAAYYCAIAALATLQERGVTLVFCHTGGRSLAVVLMYLNTMTRRGWDVWLDLLKERVDVELPIPNPIHKTAFDKIDWELLTKLLKG